MPAPVASIIRGNTSAPILIGRQLKRRADELDEGMLKFVSTSRDSFTIGGSVAQMAGLTIEDIDSVEDGGGIWEHSLSVIGKLGGPRRKRNFPDITYSLTDWDKAEDAWITNNAAYITEGQLGEFGGTMICVTANARPLCAGWWEVKGSYVGLIRDKPRQRSITVNGQTISGDRIVVQLEGGWNTPQKGQAQLPKLVVKDRYLSATPPPTALIPGPATPLDAPPVQFITYTGTDVTRYWPGGWHLASLQSEQLSSLGLWAVDWNYEYQYPRTP